MMKDYFEFNEDKLFIHIDTRETQYCCLQSMTEAFDDLTEIYSCTHIGIRDDVEEEENYMLASGMAFVTLDKMKKGEVITLYPEEVAPEMGYLQLKRIQ